MRAALWNDEVDWAAATAIVSVAVRQVESRMAIGKSLSADAQARGRSSAL
jgi:hypothetical protein